jgi:hypothetical protein
LIDRLLMNGVKFVLDKVAQAADEQLNDDSVIRQQLLEAQLQYEQGELSKRKFAAIERELLARLRSIQEARAGAAQGPIALAGQRATVEVTFEGDEEP